MRLVGIELWVECVGCEADFVAFEDWARVLDLSKVPVSQSMIQRGTIEKGGDHRDACNEVCV